MTSEFKELRRRINGKTVKWKIPDSEEYIDCIILANPDNNLPISVKPYGYTPEEIYKKYETAWGENNQPLSYFARPDYCEALFGKREPSLLVHQRLAALPVDAKSSFEEITGEGAFYLGNPSCPYSK